MNIRDKENYLVEKVMKLRQQFKELMIEKVMMHMQSK